MNDKHPALADTRVLVVEDEALVLIDLEDMLEEMGCRVVGPAMQLKAAQRLVEDGQPFDVALLDVNVAGDLVFPVAEELVKKNIPFAFASGYGRSSLLDAWADRPILQKPYTAQDLRDCLHAVLGLDGAEPNGAKA